MPRPRLDHVRKAQILTAAAAVLSERGYANARVVDIAKAAGTSPAAILYWFDGKHGLLAEALRCASGVPRSLHGPDRAGSDSLRTVADTHRGDASSLRLGAVDGAVRARRCATSRRRRSATGWTGDGGQCFARSSAMVNNAASSSPGDADETMFVLAALLDGMAPLLAMKAKGVTAAQVERTWLAEAARLLGPGFDASPLRRSR